MGPIIEPANGKLLNALTTLGAGESWAVEPQQLDDTGRLWSPGVSDGVAPRLRLPPDRVLRPGPRHHDRGHAGGGHRHPEPGRVRPHRRACTPSTRTSCGSGWTPSRPATCTSTAASPARSCSASRSAAGRSPRSAPAPRPADPNYLVGLSDWAAGAAATATAEIPAGPRDAAGGRARRSRPASPCERALRSDAAAWADGVRHREGRLRAQRRAQRLPLPTRTPSRSGSPPGATDRRPGSGSPPPARSAARR